MVLAGSAALSASAAFARPVAHARPASAITAAVNDSLARHGTPGAAVEVVQHGRVLFSRGFGLGNLETGTPVTPASVFGIGSLTKQFAAAAAIKLAALGKLDLRAPVAEHLPAFRPLKAFSTLELMHQTAGLHSDEGGEGSAAAVKTLTQIELAGEIAAQQQPFDFDPGSAWLYSNANYIVLGALIESVTGQSLAQAMRALVLAPLGLDELACDVASDIVPHRASGYTATGEAGAPFVKAAYLDPSQAGGAGAMRGTARALCQWHHALLSGRLFDQAHLDLMLAPGRLRDGRPASANRFSADDAHYGDTEYACGLLVTGPSDPRPSILHYGAISGFCAVLQTYRRDGLTFAALCNADIGPDVPFRGIRKAVVEGWPG